MAEEKQFEQNGETNPSHQHSSLHRILAAHLPPSTLKVRTLPFFYVVSGFYSSLFFPCFFLSFFVVSGVFITHALHSYM